MTKVLIAHGHQRVGKSQNGQPCLDTNILSTVHEVEEALKEKGYRTERAALRRDVRKFVQRARRFRPDVVFNLCEQVGGDTRMEKNAVALFELGRWRYTGNGSLALALCLEKAMTKRMLGVARIATPRYTVVRRGETIEDFPLPAIVKPAMADGSLGITARSVVKTRHALRKRVQYVHRRFKQAALVEQFLKGREFQVALLGNGEPTVLAVAELSFAGLPKHTPRIVSYAAKWHPATTYYRCTNPVLPPNIRERLHKKLEQAATRAFEFLGLRGYARIDFRVVRGTPFVIDVNPNPDISMDAGLARAALHAGLSYADLIERVVQLALEAP